MLQILLFLLEKGRTKVTDIQVGGSNGTLYRALNILINMELLDEERIPPFKRFIQLTPDGEAIAKKLSEINEILKAKQTRQ